MLLDNHIHSSTAALRARAQPAVAGRDGVAAPESADALQPWWRVVARCPACGSDRALGRGPLPDRCYVFADERIPLPDCGVTVTGCADCKLHYKSVVPAPAFLASVFRRHFDTGAGGKWLERHDFAPEIALLRKLSDTPRFDLIDIGAAGGDLLEQYAGSGAAGRRSALDVVRYPRLDEHLDGEFITGFLDEPVRAWSGVPYDVATLFDVFEHLYDPGTAFANLRALVRQDGLVFIETGNGASYWPQRFGIEQWWYARLIEHHVFWCREALTAAAIRHGFDVVFCREVRHKSRREMSAGNTAVDLLKVGLYRISRHAYPRLATWFGKEGNQPWHPFAKDHLQACLRKR